MDTHLNNFGPRLRALVEGRGTIEQAYAAIGVSRATLFNWFGRSTPPPGKNNVEKLRRYLGNAGPWILDNVQNQPASRSGPGRKYRIPDGPIPEGYPLDKVVLEKYVMTGSHIPSHSELETAISDAEQMEVALRADLEHLIDVADGDVGRLGWIREQFRQHLSEPVHWGMHERINQQVLAEERMREQQEKAQISGQKTHGAK